MAPEGHPEELFDVLYADKEKIDSLYAQLFSGLLQAMRRAETSAQGDSGEFNATVGFVSGGRGRRDDVSNQTEEDFLPHDITLIDTLSRLKELGYIHNSLKGVRHGSIFTCECRFSIFDSTVITNFMSNIPPEIMTSAMSGNEKQKRSQVNTMKKLSEMFFKTFTTGINFRARSTDGFQVWGSLKSESLRESSTSLVLKHGTDIHGSWFMSGIIDALPGGNAGIGVDWGDTINAFKEIAAPLQDFFGKQKEEIGVTPIAIFRKIPLKE